VKLLTISLMMSCNRACYYCPVKKWLVPMGSPRERVVNRITNEALLKWLDKYISPRDWIIEITGGEPGLYPEIQTLIPELAGRGYRGLIKTNGTLPIPKSGAFQRVAAWHEGTEIPAQYDQILIIKNPKDDWKRKILYCEENGIPYQTVLFDRGYKGKRIDTSRCGVNKMLAVLHVNSFGMITPCSARLNPIKCQDIFTMFPPIPNNNLVSGCPRCKNVADVEKFLPPDLRERLERDYERARVEINPAYATERKEKIATLLEVKQ